jgi:hypothetical protein
VVDKKTKTVKLTLFVNYPIVKANLAEEAYNYVRTCFMQQEMYGHYSDYDCDLIHVLDSEGNTYKHKKHQLTVNYYLSKPLKPLF